MLRFTCIALVFAINIYSTWGYFVMQYIKCPEVNPPVELCPKVNETECGIWQMGTDACGCCIVCLRGPGMSCGSGLAQPVCIPGYECQGEVKSDDPRKYKLGKCMLSKNGARLQMHKRTKRQAIKSGSNGKQPSTPNVSLKLIPKAIKNGKPASGIIRMPIKIGKPPINLKGPIKINQPRLYNGMPIRPGQNAYRPPNQMMPGNPNNIQPPYPRYPYANSPATYNPYYGYPKSVSNYPQMPNRNIPYPYQPGMNTPQYYSPNVPINPSASLNARLNAYLVRKNMPSPLLLKAHLRHLEEELKGRNLESKIQNELSKLQRPLPQMPMAQRPIQYPTGYPQQMPRPIQPMPLRGMPQNMVQGTSQQRFSPYPHYPIRPNMAQGRIPQIMPSVPNKTNMPMLNQNGLPVLQNNSPLMNNIRQPITNGVRQPIPNGVRQPMPNGLRQQIPNGIRQRIPNGFRQPIPNGIRQPIPNGIRQPIPNGIRQPIPSRIAQPQQQPMYNPYINPTARNYPYPRYAGNYPMVPRPQYNPIPNITKTPKKKRPLTKTERQLLAVDLQAKKIQRLAAIRRNRRLKNLLKTLKTANKSI